MAQSYDGASSSNVADDNSRDLLKNTPSNIRRLVHEIEQYESRQKYLAQTRSPSDGGDVRWFFCKIPLRVDELAASIPRTEVVGKGDYFRFGMRDSLAIEAAFLQKEDELLSYWWKEYAECSDGPKGQPSKKSKSAQPSKQTSSDNPANEEERVGVPVKGGLYEVDLMLRHCFPVYWNGENRRVLRGHWFARKGGLDWFPLREDVAEQLEYAYRGQIWHRRTFQQSGLFAARVDIQGSTAGLHALFTGEDDTWEAWLNVDASGFSGVVGSMRNGIKLRRGYAPPMSQKPTQDEVRQRQEEEVDDYCSQVPVRHLVFMVHGIGQRLENSNLVDDVGDFRQVTEALAERHLTSHQRGAQRVLFIPCQWRKGLKLTGETAVEKCTLDGVRGLRMMLGATVHDVLYYMSPIHCQDIINSVSNQLNKLYLKFLKRNPDYDGKVSIYAHSLGSVLSYDILCHQENLSSPFPMEWMFKERNRGRSPTEADVPSGSKHSPNIGDGTHNEIETESNFGSSEKPDLDTVEGGHDPSGPPTLSDSDESTAADTSNRQTRDALTSDDDTSVPFGSSCQVESSKNDEVIESNDMESDSIPSDGFKIDGDANDHEKSEVIDSLRREVVKRRPYVGFISSYNNLASPWSIVVQVDMLKAKVKEFEAVDSEANADTSTSLNQPDSKSIPFDHGNSFKSYTPQIRYTKLVFKVDSFYAVGSPLAVFLSLRNVRIGIGKGGEYGEDETITEEMPSCSQMFNIFHPFDPVAYRVEPLICKEFVKKRPIIIPYHRGGKRLHVGFQEFKEVLAMQSHALVDHISSVKVKVLTLCESIRSNGNGDEESDDASEKVERSYGEIVMERLTGSREGRVDHVLQDKTFRHAYLSAIGSHTNYWRDPDTALFILKHLYRDIPEQEESDEEGEEHSANESIGWYDPRQAADEELPLTFADNLSIKSFSYKARKAMKSSSSR